VLKNINECKNIEYKYLIRGWEDVSFNQNIIIITFNIRDNSGDKKNFQMKLNFPNSFLKMKQE